MAGRAPIQSLLKEVPSSLQLPPPLPGQANWFQHTTKEEEGEGGGRRERGREREAYISLHELGEVGVPDVADIGPLEKRDTSLVRPEGLLKVVILLQEDGVVDDDLGRGNLEVNDPIVHRLGGLRGEGVRV